MIKFIYSKEKTNAFRPEPWHWSEEPFPAFRGKSHTYTAFQAVSSDYQPEFAFDPNTGEEKAPIPDGYRCTTEAIATRACKMVTTKKGTNLIVPCDEDEDEDFLFLTLRGGFRGWYSRIVPVNATVIYHKWGNKHTVETHHMIVRLDEADGLVYAETGRRCGTGLVEIFSWSGYKTMPTEEFEAWAEMNGIDTTEEKGQ